MLQTIRPSEMCGIQNFKEPYRKAQVVEVRRASTVRIQSRPVSIIGPSQRLSSETPAVPPLLPQSRSAADAYARRSTQTGVDAKQYTRPTALRQWSDSSAFSQSSREDGVQSSQKKKKRDAVLSFLALRDRAGSPRQQQTPSSRRSSATPCATMIPLSPTTSPALMQAAPSPAQRATTITSAPILPAGRRLAQHRPTLSCFADGPYEPKLTVGTMSSRPVSFAASLPLVSRWTPSSSSSEVSLALRPDEQNRTARVPVCTATSPFETTLAADTNFLDSMRHSPAAAYLDYAGVEDEQPQTMSSEHVRANAPNQSNGTHWYSDTDAEDMHTMEATSDAHVSPPRIWAAEKTQYPYVSEHAVEVSEDDNWPLPIARSELYVPYVVHPSGARKSSHNSTLSRGTISSVSTIVSPTFSHARTNSTTASTMLSQTLSERMEQEAISIPQRQEIDAASIAPSEVSIQWTKSPKERLGLGSVVRKSQILPWEEQQQQTQPRRLQKINGDLSRRASKSNRFSALMNWRKDNL